MSSLNQKLSQLPQGLQTRFAPSPTGHLHLGHVASAIYVWGLGRRLGAKIILRMEDHDRQRSRSHFEQSILDDLQWLGLEADTGVVSARQVSAFRQSEHQERFAEALGHFEVYACDCSRKDIVARCPQDGEELLYDNHCRNRGLPLKNSYGLRIRMEAEAQHFEDLALGPQIQIPAAQCGDLLARDRDGNWTYNFAVTVDDCWEAVDLIIRGQDILHASGRQMQLRKKLKPGSSAYVLHHPLIWASPDKKLSKRDGSTAIKTYRDAGLSPEEVLGQAAHAVGLLPRAEALEAHRLEDLFR